MRAHGARARDVCAMMCDDAMRKLVVLVHHRASCLIKNRGSNAYDDRMQTFAALAVYIDDASTGRDDKFSRRDACMHSFEY